jgi:hypothetical protein
MTPAIEDTASLAFRHCAATVERLAAILARGLAPAAGRASG